MTEVSVSEARQNLADLLGRAHFKGERIVVRRAGKDYAAIVSVEDLQLIEQLEDEIDAREAKRILAEEADKAVPLDDVLARHGLKA